jgi:SHS2 domain-containing protein
MLIDLEEAAKQALFAMADQVLEFERSSENRKRRLPETGDSPANKKQKVSPVPITAQRF